MGLVAAALNIVALFQEPAAEGKPRDPPKEFRVFRSGINETRKGPYLFDDLSASMVMDAYSTHGALISFDYQHAVLNAGKGGEKAPAAGFCELELRAGELWAVKCAWNEDGDADLRAGRFIYFSPLFLSDEASGRITCLINIALTNTPAMDDLDALVAASALTHERDHQMEEQLKQARARITELEQIVAARDNTVSGQTTRITALSEEIATLKPASSVVVALGGAFGLAATAPPADVQARVVALSGFQQHALGIAGEKDPDKALGTLGAMKASHEKLGVLEKKIETERLTALTAQFDGLLAQGAKEGKIDASAGTENMGQRGWWNERLKEDGLERALKALSGFVPVAPKQVAGADDGRKPPVLTALTQAELDIAKATNSDPAKVQAFKAKKAAAAVRA